MFIFRRRHHRNVERLASCSDPYHTSLHSAKLYEQHFGSVGHSDLVAGRPCYQAVVHGSKGNDYDYTMELRPLPSVPGMSDGSHGNRVCPPTSTHAHCQCWSPYEGFNYGPECNVSNPETPYSPKPSTVKMNIPVHVPPHYFTLDTNEKRQNGNQGDGTTTFAYPVVCPKACKAHPEKIQANEDRIQRKCSFHDSTKQPAGECSELRNDSGTCSWP